MEEIQLNVNISTEEWSRAMSERERQREERRTEVPKLAAEVKSVIKWYEGETKNLYDRAGFTKYVDHQERLDHYKGERNRVLREIDEDAQEIHARIRGEADEIDQMSLLELLTSHEEDEAAAKMPLYQGQVRSGRAVQSLERAVSPPYAVLLGFT